MLLAAPTLMVSRASTHHEGGGGEMAEETEMMNEPNRVGWGRRDFWQGGGVACQHCCLVRYDRWHSFVCQGGGPGVDVRKEGLGKAGRVGAGGGGDRFTS